MQMTAWQIGLLVFALTFLSAGCGDSALKEKSTAEQMQAAMKISDPVQRTSELVKVARRQQQAGEVLDVRSTLATAAESARSIALPASRVTGLASVAAECAASGELDQAKELLHDAAKAAGEIPTADARIGPLTSLAIGVAEQLDDTTQARTYLKQAELAAQETRSPVIRARGLGTVAAAYARLSLADDALRLSQSGVEWAKGLKLPRERADCLAELGAALAKMKQAESAKAAFDAAREAAGSVESEEGRAYALLGIARNLKAAGDAAQAETVSAEARQIAGHIKDASVRQPLLEAIDK
jgi:tetratricopeptide (TPR) repeat protein